MIPEIDDSVTGPGRFRWLLAATVDITPLRRHRDFRLLFIGRLVSFFGSMISGVAFPYQVYQLTHSVLLVGVLGVLEFAAILAFAFLGGALADARDRRWLVLLTEAALLACSLALAGNAALSHPQVWLLFVIAMAWGVLDAVQRPSLDAMLPRLVDKDELAAAAALGGVRGTLGMILGPALGGVLLAAFGLSVTYLVDVATFLVGLACLWLMRAVPPPVDAAKPSLRRVLEGLRYASSRQELIGTYVVDMVAMFFGMPMALFPAIAQSLGGPTVLGLLYAAPAAGSFVFSATSGWTSRIRRHGMGVVVAAVIWGLAIIGFGFAPGLWPRPVLPRARRCGGHDEWRFPICHLEPDHSRLPTGTARIHRDAELHVRARARELRSRRRCVPLQPPCLDRFRRRPVRHRLLGVRRGAARLPRL